MVEKNSEVMEEQIEKSINLARKEQRSNRKNRKIKVDQNAVRKEKKGKKNKKNKNDSPLLDEIKKNNVDVFKKKEKRKKIDVEDDDNEVENKKKLKKKKNSKKDDVLTTEKEDNMEQSINKGQENDEIKEGRIKKKELSKRQIKKEKAELRAAEATETSKQEHSQKALNYISKWKHAKNEWKFNKVIQIWLIDNMLNDKYIPNDHFPTVIEYFEGCKGGARKQLIDKAMKVIKNIEESVEEDEQVVETTEYKRARQLLQALPTET